MARRGRQPGQDGTQRDGRSRPGRRPGSVPRPGPWQAAEAVQLWPGPRRDGRRDRPPATRATCSPANGPGNFIGMRGGPGREPSRPLMRPGLSACPPPVGPPPGPGGRCCLVLAGLRCRPLARPGAPRPLRRLAAAPRAIPPGDSRAQGSGRALRALAPGPARRWALACPALRPALAGPPSRPRAASAPARGHSVKAARQRAARAAISAPGLSPLSPSRPPPPSGGRGRRRG